ncbi:lipopolysaccharide biosynthesis protein [Lachnospiraceae bacterium ZAX-1]
MINRSEVIWNIVASICAAALSFVLLLLVTRINGVDQGGMFSIAFATATVLNAMADFGMRVYQVTDTKKVYSFGVYVSARWAVDLAMILCGAAFIILSGYSIEKAGVCFGLIFFRFVDGLSETYQGEFQLNERLDLAGKSVFIRMVLSVAVFFMVDMLTKNLLASIISLTLTNLLLFILYDVRLISNYTKERPSFRADQIGTVIKDCFPLFLSTFLNNYIINAPKYAIDKLPSSYEMQAFFNILYLPTFTINLMSIFVLKPMLRTLGVMWNEKEDRKFLAVVGKMAVAIIILTIGVELVCAFLGIPVLSLIFGVDLAAYKAELLILVLAGGFSALSVVLFYALTTMRAQGKVGIAYLVSALLGLFCSNLLVREYKILGAAISSVALLATLFLTLLALFFYEWKKRLKMSTMC